MEGTYRIPTNPSMSDALWVHLHRPHTRKVDLLMLSSYILVLRAGNLLVVSSPRVFRDLDRLLPHLPRALLPQVFPPKFGSVFVVGI